MPSKFWAPAGRGAGGHMRWHGWVLGLLLCAQGLAFAADPDLAQARQLLGEGRYQEAYALLQPHAPAAQDDAAFNLLLGEAALRSQRPGDAKDAFERALAAQPDSVDAHLGLGRAYLALGEYARAVVVFETVLRLDNPPADLQLRAENYAAIAQDRADGRRLALHGYAIAGVGNYRIGALGGGPRNDRFFAGRVGGNLGYELERNYALNGSLDYRFRDYNNQRRNDSDLRWNASLSRAVGDASWAIGTRGRSSYRGNSDFRNDFGVFGNYRIELDADNSVGTELWIWQRRYPTGPLRDRTRNTAELSGHWTHALLDGRASFTLAVHGGREHNTARPDGLANFFGVSPALDFSITKNLGGFAFFWYQHDRYNAERLGAPGDGLIGVGTRTDNLYEVGGGLTWQFLPTWSLNPEVLYIRDSSNLLAARYSSTEIWITLRKDF